MAEWNDGQSHYTQYMHQCPWDVVSPGPSAIFPKVVSVELSRWQTHCRWKFASNSPSKYPEMLKYIPNAEKKKQKSKKF